MYPAHRNPSPVRMTARGHFVRRAVAWVALAAGLALAVPASAQQADSSTYGPVRRADTLWELALRFRGDTGVSAHQAMIAILRANPEAFREGNINALRTGITLRVPTAAEMSAVTREEALAEFARHEEAWRNRSRTGTAAPGPAASSPARPAPQPAPAAPPEPAEPTLAQQLEESRARVAELRERLVERDEAIEELLVQFAAARRALRDAQQGGAGTGADPEAPAGEDAGAGPVAGASWLPVSPLILGSSLIVLLVLIVVVTLLRQRGGGEEPYPEEPDENEGEVSLDEEEVGEEALREAGGEDGVPEMEEPGEARGEPAPRRTRGPASAGAAAATTGGFAATAHDLASEEEDEDLPVEEGADLPIGMDLEGEEEWIPQDEDVPRGEEVPRGEAGLEVPGDPTEFDRHVEVGELDDLDLDTVPARSTFSDLPEDFGEDDDPRGRRRD